MPVKPRHLRPRRGQRGMSLVELMVGVVVGLIVVAAATVMAASQLTENRRLLLETQVQQDMRATMELLTREIRRAGNRDLLTVLWNPARPDLDPIENDYRTVDVGAQSDAITIRYQRPTYGTTCNASPDIEYYQDGDEVKSRICGVAEPITDRNAMVVLSLSFTPGTSVVEYLTCPKLCPSGAEDCWPTFTTRDIQITLSARSPLDPPNVVRTMTSRVRLRGDRLELGTAATQLCPP